MQGCKYDANEVAADADDRRQLRETEAAPGGYSASLGDGRFPGSSSECVEVSQPRPAGLVHEVDE